jgi:hypothetical protein
MVRPLQGRESLLGIRSVGLHLRLLTVSRSAGLLLFLLCYPLRKDRRRNPAEFQNTTFMTRTSFTLTHYYGTV